MAKAPDPRAMPTWQEFRQREPNYVKLSQTEKISLRASYENMFVEESKKLAERDARDMLERARNTDMSEAVEPPEPPPPPDPNDARRARFAEEQEIASLEREPPLPIVNAADR